MENRKYKFKHFQTYKWINYETPGPGNMNLKYGRRNVLAFVTKLLNNML
jgi:hypothetical protein